jgi:hypothetical protein
MNHPMTEQVALPLTLLQAVLPPKLRELRQKLICFVETFHRAATSCDA